MAVNDGEEEQLPDWRHVGERVAVGVWLHVHVDVSQGVKLLLSVSDQEGLTERVTEPAEQVSDCVKLNVALCVSDVGVQVGGVIVAETVLLLEGVRLADGDSDPEAV